MWRWMWSWGLLLCAVIAQAAGEVIAVSDFVGKPAEIGQEIAETLGTDLAKSERITLVERSQLGQALRELRLQSTGLTEPAQARKVGKLVGADAIIVGSFYLRGNQIVINARVVDVRTGKVMAGRAENVQGKLSDLYILLGDLANRLHVRLTGQELASVEPGTAKWTSPNVRIADAQDDPEILYVVQQGWMQGTPDGYFLPDKPVTVGDFARVISRLAAARRWRRGVFERHGGVSQQSSAGAGGLPDAGHQRPGRGRNQLLLHSQCHGRLAAARHQSGRGRDSSVLGHLFGLEFRFLARGSWPFRSPALATSPDRRPTGAVLERRGFHSGGSRGVVRSVVCRWRQQPPGR